MDRSRSASQHGYLARRSQAETALVVMRHFISCMRWWWAGLLANVSVRDRPALGSRHNRRP